MENNVEKRPKLEHDLLVRAYRGEDVHRAPVWLMRQVSTCEKSKVYCCTL